MLGNKLNPRFELDIDDHGHEGAWGYCPECGIEQWGRYYVDRNDNEMIECSECFEILEPINEYGD